MTQHPISLSEQQRVDAVCREIGLLLRRLAGRCADSLNDNHLPQAITDDDAGASETCTRSDKDVR